MKAISCKVKMPATEVDIDTSPYSLVEYIGGPVEAFNLFDNEDVLVLCYENGQKEGLPANRLLLEDVKKSIFNIFKREEERTMEMIYGDFLLVGIKDGQISEMPDNLMKKYLSELG